MSAALFDVVGLGNAIVDVISQQDDAFLSKWGINKDAMNMIEEDRADLAWHKREFDAKSSFAYHLLDHDASECLGCLYLYPTAAQEHDAEAYLWVHTRLAQVQATFIENEVIEWVRQCWPFSAVAWPGRFIPFTDWEVTARPNYYASNRVSDTPLNIGI